MMYTLTATYERDGKNNHVRRKYFVYAADKTEAEEKVLRSKAIRNKIFVNGISFVLDKLSVREYEY